jgi:outer membrane protein assembly factor BamE (lipoprotein component of BamABCDE complex)
MHRTRTAALAAAAVLVPMTMTGCLISSSRANKIEGAYVQPGAVSRVQLNETTTTETEEIMGQPSFRKANDDGTETWTWHWTETKGESGAVLLIFAGNSKKTVSESVHVKFKDGVAIKKWRD